MKAKTLLVAAVMFLGLTAAAFAQVGTFSVGYTPVTAITATGYTEAAGAVTFNLQNGVASPTTAGTFTLSYGVPITSTMSTLNNVVNVTAVGCLAADVTVTTPPSNNAAGQLVVSVPTACTTLSFTIQGVRISAVGFTGTSVFATISAVGNAIIGNNSVQVVTSISPGLSAGTTTAGVMRAIDGVVTTQPVLKVKEGYLNAFADLNYNQLGTNFPLWLRFTLTGTIPAGVTLQFPATATTDGAGAPQFMMIDPSSTARPPAAIATNPTFDSTTTGPIYVYYALASNSDQSKLETATFTLTMAKASGASLPIGAGSLSATVTLAPIGTGAFDADGNVIANATGKTPRFQASEISLGSIFSISTQQTNLLIPYASTITASAYNTGIAVANTTLDPGKTALGFAKAVAQTGAVCFYMFPQQVGSTLPTSITYCTVAGSPGTGLDSNGKLPAGSSYTVLLSQLLAAASAPADFQGYIFVITGFTNAHLQYFISDFNTFSNGGQAMIVEQDRTVVPEALMH
jgi:hypothetical protein